MSLQIVKSIPNSPSLPKVEHKGRFTIISLSKESPLAPSQDRETLEKSIQQFSRFTIFTPEIKSNDLPPKHFVVKTTQQTESVQPQQNKPWEIIQRIVRQRFTPILLLKENSQAFAEMPSEQYRRLIQTFVKAIQRRQIATHSNLHLHLQNLVNEIIQKRTEYQLGCTNILLRPTQFRHTPDYQLAPTPSQFLSENATCLQPGLYLTQADPVQNPIHSLEQLDSIVQELSSKRNLFAWEFWDDGCFARAYFMRFFLEQSGIPEEQIAKIYFINNQDTQQNNWIYHVAIVIAIKESKEKSSFRVIDPMLSPDRSLAIEEWARLQSTDCDYFGTLKENQIRISSQKPTILIRPSKDILGYIEREPEIICYFRNDSIQDFYDYINVLCQNKLHADKNLTLKILDQETKHSDIF